MVFDGGAPAHPAEDLSAVDLTYYDLGNAGTGCCVRRPQPLTWNTGSVCK